MLFVAFLQAPTAAEGSHGKLLHTPANQVCTGMGTAQPSQHASSCWLPLLKARQWAPVVICVSTCCLSAPCLSLLQTQVNQKRPVPDTPTHATATKKVQPHLSRTSCHQTRTQSIHPSRCLYPTASAQKKSDVTFTWPRPAPPRQTTTTGNVTFFAHNPPKHQTAAEAVAEYLGGLPADHVPLTVHLSGSLIYTKPIPGVFRAGELPFFSGLQVPSAACVAVVVQQAGNVHSITVLPACLYRH
jgi:hypothetical protein